MSLLQRIAGPAILALALSGCMHTAIKTSIQSASTLYASLYQCPIEQVQGESLYHERAIMIRGCGFEQLYSCGINVPCVRDGERRAAPQNAQPKQ